MTFQELSVTSRGHSFGDSLTVKHTTPIYSWQSWDFAWYSDLLQQTLAQVGDDACNSWSYKIHTYKVDNYRFQVTLAKFLLPRPESWYGLGDTFHGPMVFVGSTVCSICLVVLAWCQYVCCFTCAISCETECLSVFTPVWLLLKHVQW